MGSSKQEFGPELEYRSQNGLRTEFAYTDPATGESEQITRSAEFGTYYKMSLVHTDSMNSMYLNGELIKEFSSTGFAPDTIGFAAFNDDGLPYVTYVKNVRVLRRQGENSGHDDGNETNSPGDGDSIVQDSNGTWRIMMTLVPELSHPISGKLVIGMVPRHPKLWMVRLGYQAMVVG